jgi:hypothetical protein
MRQTYPRRLDDRDTITSLNLLLFSVQPRRWLTIERVGEYAAHERLLHPTRDLRLVLVGKDGTPGDVCRCRGNGYSFQVGSFMVLLKRSTVYIPLEQHRRELSSAKQTRSCQKQKGVQSIAANKRRYASGE